MKLVTEWEHLTLSETDTITQQGIVLYRLTSSLSAEDGGIDVGINVYAATTASIGDGASIGAWASIGDGTSIGYGVRIGAWASIGDGTSIGDCASIGACAIIGDDAIIGDGARIGACASIGDGISYDFMLIGPIGSRNAYTSFWRHKDGSIRVSCGCFSDTLDAFELRVNKVHGDNAHGVAYKAAIAMVRAVMVREV